MTRIDKLYAQLVQSPDRAVSFRDFVRLIEAFGFEHQRTRGSHQSFAHPTCPKLLVIQPRGKEAKRHQIRDFLEVIEEHGLYIKP